MTTSNSVLTAGRTDGSVKVAAPGRIAEARMLLTDPRYARDTNLARLQGWRGEDLAASVAAGRRAHRVGPAFCGLLSLAIALTGSPVLLATTLATALIGVRAPNHPVELGYAVWARRAGEQPLPPNRAAKRLACAVGSLFLIGAAVSMAVGATVVGNVLLVTLGTLALFVAATGICVPSIMFTLMFGADRGARAQLIG